MEPFERIAKILGPLTREQRKEAVSQALRSVTFAESTLGKRVRKPRIRKEVITNVVPGTPVLDEP